MLSKERIFQIMGKYYGNVYYRSAIRLNSSEKDLHTITSFLDEVNSLGYRVSNIHALSSIEDLRLVPIILRYCDKFEADNYRSALIGLLGFRSYEKYVPQLISLYENANSIQYKLDISDALFRICSKKHQSEYLRLVSNPDYGASFDHLLALLCKLRVKEAIPVLLRLYETNPHDWYWTLLKYAPYTKAIAIRPHIFLMLESQDCEIRSLARKALEKLDK